jgi:hypothetical protein
MHHLLSVDASSWPVKPNVDYTGVTTLRLWTTSQ